MTKLWLSAKSFLHGIRSANVCFLLSNKSKGFLWDSKSPLTGNVSSDLEVTLPRKDISYIQHAFRIEVNYWMKREFTFHSYITIAICPCEPSSNVTKLL